MIKSGRMRKGHITSGRKRVMSHKDELIDLHSNLVRKFQQKILHGTLSMD